MCNKDNVKSVIQEYICNTGIFVKNMWNTLIDTRGRVSMSRRVSVDFDPRGISVCLRGIIGSALPRAVEPGWQPSSSQERISPDRGKLVREKVMRSLGG